MGAERWDEQVGSVADEATRLLESLRRTAEAAAESAADRPEGGDGPDAAAPGPASGSPGAGAASGMPGDGTAPGPGAAPPHDPACTWCPLCRGAAVVRSLSPQTLTRLADLAGLAATVLADLASTRTAAEPPASDPADPPAPAPSHPATRPRRATPAPSAPIPVRDADDPQEAPRG